MADLTANVLTSGTSGSDTTSYNTASISPSSNKLILIGLTSRVSEGTFADPTVSGGGGVTWVKVLKLIFRGTPGDNCLWIYRGMEASPTSGGVNFLFGETMWHCAWNITEFTNMDTGGTSGSAAVVQSASAKTEGATSISATLAAFGDAANGVYAAYDADSGSVNAFTPGAGLTELSDTDIEQGQFGSSWRKDNDTTPSVSYTPSTQAAIVCLEIKNATPAPLPTSTGAVGHLGFSF